MYVRYTKALSCNNSCSGKATSITYSEIAFVELSIEQAMRMRHIAICGQLDCTVLFHTVS